MYFAATSFFLANCRVESSVADCNTEEINCEYTGNVFRCAFSSKWHLRRASVKQHGDTNCGFEGENKNTQLSSEKDRRGTKELQKDTEPR